MADTRRRGFVLPTTVLVMALLTVMLTAAFVMVSAEYRTTDNSVEMRYAYAVAQSGLQNYIGQIRTISGTYDSLRVSYTNGYADVVANRMVGATGGVSELWLVRSTGYRTIATFSGVTAAQRTVARLAYRNTGSLPARSAMIALNPIVLNGGPASPLDGWDGCGATNSTGLTAVTGTYAGGAPRGGADYYATVAEVYDSSHVDWTRILAGDITPDYEVPSWPASYATYPIGINYGDLSLNSGTRQGILIVTGNLYISGSFRWEGVVLVGGRLVQSSASAKVQGTIITGLNDYITPGSAGTDTLMGGSRTIQWHTCHIATAADALTGFSTIDNTFTDSWSNY